MRLDKYRREEYLRRLLGDKFDPNYYKTSQRQSASSLAEPKYAKSTPVILKPKGKSMGAGNFE